MESAWHRVIALAEKRAPGRAVAWLAEQLGYEIQRVQNWKTRGVPRAEYPLIAERLGEPPTG